MSSINKDKMHSPLAIVALHSTEVFGPPYALIDYLKRQNWEVVVIDHPLDYNPNRQSQVTFWQGNDLIKQFNYPNWLAFSPVNYFKDFAVSLWVLWRYLRNRPVDYFFGCDSLSSLAALWLRPLMKVKKYIAYNTDYSTDRFSQPILNSLYLWADRYTIKRVNAIWCVTQRVVRIRQEELSKLGKKSPVVLVPNGAYLNNFPAVGRHNQGLVFIGNLTPEKGIEPILHALVESPKVKLTIYGDGQLRPSLEALAKQLGIDERVKFAGQVANSTILNSLSDYEAGIALYQDSQSYVYYSDPLKVKEYLAAGLPVIISSLPEISSIIQSANCGIIVNDPTELAEAIERIIKAGQSMRMKAKQLAKNYDWDKIFAFAIVES